MKSFTPSLSSRPARPLSRERARRGLGKLLLIVALSLGAVVMVFPFLWMFSTSMRLASEVYKLPPSILPEKIRLDAYVKVFQTGVPFVSFFLNSCKVTFSTVLLQVGTGALAAYAFARLRFRGKGFLFALLLSAMMIPKQVTSIPLYIILGRLRLIDTHWALILPEIVFAYGIFFLRQNFLSQPFETEEAARIDGAGFGAIFYRIALPQAGSVLAALSMISFNNTWNEYYTPLIYLDTWEKMTLPLGISVIKNNLYSAGLQVILASIILAIIPTFLVFCFAQRHIVEGISMSGLKG